LVRSNIKWASLFAGSKEESALSVAPILLLISATGTEDALLIDWISKHGTFSSSVLLLVSILPFPELTLRLTVRLEAEISDGMSVMFRYYDPRVFEALVTIFDDKQKSEFLGVADCWWYVNRSGEMISVPSVHQEIDTCPFPVKISSHQEFAFIDASELDQIAHLIKTVLPNHYDNLDAATRFQFIRRHSKAAAQFGILATSEAAMYCILALLYGENFADSEEWSVKLRSLIPEKLMLSDIVIYTESTSGNFDEVSI
jgi:hypothetical protein